MKNTTINSAYALRNEYYKHNPDGHYFDAETLKFWGERFSEFSVLKEMTVIHDYRGTAHNCYVLSKITKDYRGRRVRKYDYFDGETFDRVLPVEA